MQTGWLYLSTGTYYLEVSGAMRTADLTEGSITYRFLPTGECRNPYGDTAYRTDGSTDYSNWVSYHYSSIEELNQAVASGNVIWKDGRYLASPDYMNGRELEENIIDRITNIPLDQLYDMSGFDDDSQPVMDLGGIS